MTGQEKIERMEAIAIEAGFKIVESRTPAFDFTHAIKGDRKVWICTSSHAECKINNFTDFRYELENN